VRHQLGRQVGSQIALPRAGLDQAEGRPRGHGVGQLLQPLGQLGGEQGGKVGTERGGGGEVAPRAHPQAATAVGAMVRVMQGPVHVLAKPHSTARLAQTRGQPGGAGPMRRLGSSVGGLAHGVALASVRMHLP